MKESITDNGNHLSGSECKICGNKSDNELIIAHEKRLGLGDKFEYFVCGKCKCLQIKDFPDKIERYYPPDYYSFQEAIFPSKLNVLTFFLKRSLIDYYMGNFNITGLLLSFLFEHPFPWIRKKEINFNTKILDVGSGSGRKLLSLQRSGFKNLTGIDPFIEKDIHYENGVRILKREISEIDDKYDFIVLHHSFEHMPDPEQVFKHISRLLKADGCALIRVPVSNSFAWRKYRECWVGLDAPRHFFLHTPESMSILSNKTDLKIEEIIFDSSAFQFTGSEKYLRNLPYSTPDNIFTKKEFREFTKQAKKLNIDKQGDTACFYLKKKV
jgi:SAM-dependent methyltransferase